MGDHVFICYSRKDEDFVLELAKNLKNQGVPVWLDQWDIPSGANWNRAIEAALNECTSLLLVLSPSSVESDDVQSEWLIALDEEKVVVPVLYRSCKIPFRLKSIQYIDFTLHNLDDKWSLEMVSNALKTVIVRKQVLGETHKFPDEVVHQNQNNRNISSLNSSIKMSAVIDKTTETKYDINKLASRNDKMFMTRLIIILIFTFIFLYFILSGYY